MISPKLAGFTLTIILTSACLVERAAPFSVKLQDQREIGNSHLHVAEMIGDTADTLPPHFLLDLYECLTSTQKDPCLESLQDIRNQDFTVSGGVGEVLSNESRSSSFTVSFSKLAPSDSLHAVEVHVFKEALSVAELWNVVDTTFCDMSNGIEIEFSLEGFANGTTRRYTETSIIVLSIDDLLKNQWIVLTGLKIIYGTWIDDGNNELLLSVNVNEHCTSISHKLRNETEGWEPVLIRVLTSEFDEVDFFQEPLFGSKMKRSQQFEDSSTVPSDINVIETRCRVFDYVVKFIDVTGFKVVPPAYSANYCTGNCRYPLPEATYHAQIQAILYDKNSTKIPPPCCVPIEYDPILILVSNPSTGKFEVQCHNEASVTKCACR